MEVVIGVAGMLVLGGLYVALGLADRGAGPCGGCGSAELPDGGCGSCSLDERVDGERTTRTAGRGPARRSGTT